MTASQTLTPGDIYVSYNSEKQQWNATKLLVLDEWPDDMSTAHCLFYQSMTDRPTLASLMDAEVFIWHVPMYASSLGMESEYLGNNPVTDDDLSGFLVYLKHTNFPRYIEVTGQELKEVTRQASAHYRRGYELTDQGQSNEAIEEYTKAIDLFPFFYEALDNRAFIYMDYGRNEEALQGFEESLEVNPEGSTAFFSKGECLMKLGRLDEAESIFAEGVTRFPEKGALFAKFLDGVRGVQGNSNL